VRPQSGGGTPPELAGVDACATTSALGQASSPAVLKKWDAPQQPVKVVALVGESPTRRMGRFTAEPPGACRPARGARGVSSPGIEPMGLNEDEPQLMSLLTVHNRRRRVPGASRIREIRSSGLMRGEVEQRTDNYRQFNPPVPLRLLYRRHIRGRRI